MIAPLSEHMLWEPNGTVERTLKEIWAPSQMALPGSLFTNPGLPVLIHKREIKIIQSDIKNYCSMGSDGR